MEANNMVAMREALLAIRQTMMYDSGIGPTTKFHTEVDTITQVALSEPPRNCDMYANYNDAMKAFEEFVRGQGKLGFINPYTEAFKWLFAPATEKEGGKDGNE